MPARLPFITALILSLCCAAPQADAGEKTISVLAVGEANIRPDTVVLSGTISESSEKMKDAVTAFRDTRRRALASINAIEIENMTATTSALSLELAGNPAQMNPFGGVDDGVEKAPEGALTIRQSVTLTVTGLDQMEQQAVIDLVVKIIESAKEAGVELAKSPGPESMIQMQFGMGMSGTAAAVFKISDPQAARKAATKDAVDKARADAAFLAELAGGRLGPVVAIGDAAAPAGESDSPMNPYALIFGMMTQDGNGEFSSDTLEDITVVRALNVSFELISE